MILHRLPRRASALLVPVLVAAAALAGAPSCASSGPGDRPDALATNLVGHVAFSGGDGRIWTMAADGTGRRQVTHGADGVDFDPHWSPDGEQLVFRSTRYHPPDPTHTGYDGIYVINADGTGEHPVHAPGGRLFPNWSPDGHTILFSGPRPDGSEGLFSVRPDGTERRDLATYAEHVEWSPDGGFLTLDREDDEPGQNWEIWRARADLTGLVRLTNAPGDDHTGAWSPDSSRIAFSTTRAGSSDVWVMNADGSGPRRIIGWDGAQAPLAWFPDGRILFVDDAPGQAPRYYVTSDAGRRTGQVPSLAGIDAPIAWTAR